MEERKALETKVGDQGATRRVPFPCPCPVGPSPTDTGAQLLTHLFRERRRQAKVGGRAKDIHSLGGMLQRKEGGTVPARRRAQGIYFHSLPPLGIYVCSHHHGFLPTLNLDGFAPPATRIWESTRLPPCKQPLPPTPFSKSKTGHLRAGHNPTPPSLPAEIPCSTVPHCQGQGGPPGAAKPLMVMVVHVVEVGGCHGAERGRGLEPMPRVERWARARPVGEASWRHP